MIFSFKFQGKDYKFEDTQLSLGEARWIKRETGLYGQDFFHAVQTLDPDAISCIVVMAMRRAGATDATIEAIEEEINGYGEFAITVKAEATENDGPAPNRAARRRNAAAVK